MPAVMPLTTSTSTPAAGKRQHFLAAATEHERIAAFEPRDDPARARACRIISRSMKRCGVDRHPPRLPTSITRASRARMHERAAIDQRIDQHDVGARRAHAPPSASSTRDRRVPRRSATLCLPSRQSPLATTTSAGAAMTARTQAVRGDPVGSCDEDAAADDVAQRHPEEIPRGAGQALPSPGAWPINASPNTVMLATLCSKPQAMNTIRRRR